MHTHTETEHCGLLWSGAQVVGDRGVMGLCGWLCIGRQKVQAVSGQRSAISLQQSDNVDDYVEARTLTCVFIAGVAGISF